MAPNSTLDFFLQCTPFWVSSLFNFPSKIGVHFEEWFILGVVIRLPKIATSFTSSYKDKELHAKAFFYK